MTGPVMKRVDIRALKIAIIVLVIPNLVFKISDIIGPVEFLSHEECCMLYPGWIEYDGFWNADHNILTAI